MTEHPRREGAERLNLYVWSGPTAWQKQNAELVRTNRRAATVIEAAE